MRFEYDGNDIAVGFLFATKPLVQLLVNPFVGALVDHLGHDAPMLAGLLVHFASALVFTHTTTFHWLFAARALQGLGSAVATTSGFSMLAHLFAEQGERARAMGLVITCLAVGSFMSVPFSGFLFEYAGKRVPFVCLAVLALFDAVLLVGSWHQRCCDKGSSAQDGKPVRGFEPF
jgi:DHA1 family vesicular acetylcholine transporter-like MFS transporter 3